MGLKPAASSLNTSAAAFTSLRCCWLSNSLLEEEMWLDPITSKPICFADWAIESSYARAFSSFSFRCRLLIVKSKKRCVKSENATTQCSCERQRANALHSLTLLLKLFSISNTFKLWKHICKTGISKANLNLWPWGSATESNYSVVFFLFWMQALKIQPDIYRQHRKDQIQALHKLVKSFFFHAGELEDASAHLRLFWAVVESN